MIPPSPVNAPFAGTVVAVYIDEFQSVRPSERIVRVVDPAQIEMVVDFSESLFGAGGRAAIIGANVC